MSVARVTELSAVSETSFEDAIQQGVTRATSTLRGVEGAWIKDMNVLIEDGNMTAAPVTTSIEKPDAIAVTVEPAGGSEKKPTGDPVLLTEL